MNQIALDQSNCKIFKATISLEQKNEKVMFLPVDTNSLKLKVDCKILGWACSKMTVAITFHTPLAPWLGSVTQTRYKVLRDLLVETRIQGYD